MRTKHRIESVLYHVLICGFGFIMIYPVLWMISGAFKNNTEILNGGLSLIPEVWRWENFVNGWSGFGGISFGTFVDRGGYFYIRNRDQFRMCCVCIFKDQIQRKQDLVYGNALYHDASGADHFGAAVYYLQ